jgi:hypothetical protein
MLVAIRRTPDIAAFRHIALHRKGDLLTARPFVRAQFV